MTSGQITASSSACRTTQGRHRRGAGARPVARGPARAAGALRARPARRRTIFREEFFVPDDHPAITRLWEEGGFAGEQDALFEWGLQRVLDGIQARIDAMAG